MRKAVWLIVRGQHNMDRVCSDRVRRATWTSFCYK